jgi:two-component system chemotaxis response regulator CheY
MHIDRSAPVLIVEPRQAAVVLISEWLSKLGFLTVETAADGATALERLTASGAKLVLADLRIRPAGALHLLRIIRSSDRLKRTAFVIAAETLSGSEARAIKSAGVDSFLLKPFSEKVLQEKIEAAFKAIPAVRVAPEPRPKYSKTTALGRRYHGYRD